MKGKGFGGNVVSSCLKRQLLCTQNPSLFHGSRYKASVRQCAYRMMRDRTSANKVGQHIVHAANAFGIHVTRVPCRRTFDRWRVEGGESAWWSSLLRWAQAPSTCLFLMMGTVLHAHWAKPFVLKFHARNAVFYPLPLPTIMFCNSKRHCIHGPWIPSLLCNLRAREWQSY